MNDIPLPWQPRSRQKEGGKTEKSLIKKAGGRAHPMSGAGSIKWDGSDDENLYEIKDANKTISVGGRLLSDLLRDANSQGKDAMFIVHFQDADVTLVGQVFRGKVVT